MDQDELVSSHLILFLHLLPAFPFPTGAQDILRLWITKVGIDSCQLRDKGSYLLSTKSKKKFLKK